MPTCKVLLFLLIITLLSCVAIETTKSATQTDGNSQNDTWEMFQHDPLHNGVSLTAGPIQPIKIWSYNEGGADNIFISSSPAVANGLVYVGFNYNQTHGNGVGVYAFDAYTGTKIWVYPTNSISVYSSPAIWENKVFISIGYVYALDALNGAKIWNSTVSGIVYSSPVIVNDIVYVGSINSNVYALNASTGAEIWSFTTADAVASSPAVSNGVVYVGSDDGNVYALDSLTGEQIWNFQTQYSIHSSPVISDGMVYVGSMDGYVYSLNCSNGNKVWRTQISLNTTNYYQRGVQATPAVSNGIVYVGSYDGAFYALNASTGSPIWKRADLFTGVSSATIADSNVYLCANTQLYALDKVNGTTIWSIPIGQAIKSSPALNNGILYISSQEGTFYAIGKATSFPSTPSSISQGTTSDLFWVLLLSIFLVIIGIIVATMLYKRNNSKKTSALISEH
jgi:eukaryotic-like serine/threonine-protein kinase